MNPPNRTPRIPMKTTTALALKAKPSTAARPLEIQPFTVTTEWVSVTTSILARHDKRMQGISGFQTRPAHFCKKLVRNYLNASDSNRRLQIECMAHGSVTGRATRPFTFTIEARRWAELVTLCNRINSTPTAFIRAAVASAAQAWDRFEEQARPA